MNITDTRCAESRAQFLAEDEERIANIRQYIGYELLPEHRAYAVAEFDKLIARYKLYTKDDLLAGER